MGHSGNGGIYSPSTLLGRAVPGPRGSQGGHSRSQQQPRPSGAPDFVAKIPGLVKRAEAQARSVGPGPLAWEWAGAAGCRGPALGSGEARRGAARPSAASVSRSSLQYASHRGRSLASRRLELFHHQKPRETGAGRGAGRESDTGAELRKQTGPTPASPLWAGAPSSRPGWMGGPRGPPAPGSFASQREREGCPGPARQVPPLIEQVSAPSEGHLAVLSLLSPHPAGARQPHR